MLRWLSLLEPETLKKCMGLKQFKNSEMTNAIRAKIPEVCLLRIREKFRVGAIRVRKRFDFWSRYDKQFTNLGILNEELLAFAPPALLNSCPLAILEDKKKIL